MAVFRKTHVRWILNGERVPAKTPGAKKVRERSRLWYGRYLDHGGRERTVALADRKGDAESELVRLRDEAERRRRNPTYVDHAEIPLADHLNAWRERLEAEGNTADHVSRHVFRAEQVLASSGAGRITAISADGVIRAVARMKKANGWSDGTAAHYLAATKGFSRWLWRSGRLAADPLAGLSVSRGTAKKRRRSLSEKEFATLLAITKASRRVAGVKGKGADWRMTGLDRFRLYLTAARTGLRASELAALVPADFDLDAGTVRAKVCTGNKAKREEVLPIPADLVDEVRPWLGSLPRDRRLWPGSWAQRRKAVYILKADLKAAGISYATDEGDFDFHALRGQYASELVRAGANPKVAQRLMRHSSITLTMNLYAKASAAELAEVVAKLPRMNSRP